MCHTKKIDFFGNLMEYKELSEQVEAIRFGGSGRRIAILPDIFGLTDFYRGYASYIANFGADVFLVNPWAEFGGPRDISRDAAYDRRAKIKDKEYCDHLELFLAEQNIDAVVGFCLGGNFALELARRGYAGTNVSIYPLPWGMDNQDKITPAFEFMPTLSKEVTIFMGEADHLAGAENIRKIIDQVAMNDKLTLNLYSGSNHGFFTDIDGEDEQLKENALDAITKVNHILFPNND